jgi:hypothetical protein
MRILSLRCLLSLRLFFFLSKTGLGVQKNHANESFYTDIRIKCTIWCETTASALESVSHRKQCFIQFYIVDVTSISCEIAWQLSPVLNKSKWSKLLVSFALMNNFSPLSSLHRHRKQLARSKLHAKHQSKHCQYQQQPDFSTHLAAGISAASDVVINASLTQQFTKFRKHNAHLESAAPGRQLDAAPRPWHFLHVFL